jgi:hypothetical protein
MKQKEILKLASKYLRLSNDLDRDGFDKEAALIDLEVSYVLENDFMKKKASNEKNVKVAIRGQSTLEDYGKSATQGAIGGGIGGGIMTGGIFAPLGAAIGAGMGVASTAGDDYWYNNVMGRWSKANALVEDFTSTAKRLSQLVRDIDPSLAQELMIYSEYAAQNVKQQITQRKTELSAKYGLDPNKGFMQTIMHPGRNLARLRDFRASIENKMTRTAQNPIIGEKSYGWFPSWHGGEWAAKALGKPLVGGWGVLGGGLVGGAAAYGAGFGYDAIANAIKGRSGQIKMLSSDLNKIGQQLTQLTGDPTHAQMGSQFSDRLNQILAMGANPMQSGANPNAFSQGQGQSQQGEPQMVQ